MPTAYYPVNGSYKAWTPEMVGAAAASHTHNYAGSSSAGGAAKVAESLNGVACYVTFSSATKPYWRCLKFESKKDWVDASAVLCIDAGYEHGGFGIVAIRHRNEEISKNANVSRGEVLWLCRYGFEADQLIYKVNSVKGDTCYGDLYFKATSTYNACNIRILNAGARGSNGNEFTLVNDAPRANPDVRTYTHTYTGHDVGVMSYNNLTNKPTIPSVGNGTITITQGGASKGSFTTNQSGNATIALTDNNTWRGIQNNLTSTSTTDSLSAAQGKVLNDKLTSLITISSTKPTSDDCKIWVKI